MVTDRMVTVSNRRESLVLTDPPFYVENIYGFDSLDVRIVTSQGFGQDGSSLVNVYTEQRAMKIEGAISAAATGQMQALRSAILNLFMPKEKLTIKHSYGGITRTITADAEKTPAFKFTKVSRIQTYAVNMTATDPFWYEDGNSLVEMASTKGAFRFVLAIPVRRGVIFGRKSTSKIASLPNRSAVKLGMTITFTAKGEVVNPYVLNVYTRECMRLNCVMRAGQTVTITTGQDKTADSRINGVSEDYIGYVDIAGGNGIFLELDVGDNLLRYGADGGEEYLAVKFVYANKYIGV